MPYCQITPDLSLFYITNTPHNDVTRFDLSKPTILLLHPVSLDVTWLRNQFEDPRLNEAYNMIAFDQRNAGRTKSRHSGQRDSYVDAADIAFALELLQLPPVHIFAVQLNSIWSACRFAFLFPSKCVSLCLCGVPADEPLDWVKKAFGDLIEIWAFPQSLEVYEEAILEMSYFMWSGQIGPDLLDEVAEWWMTNCPPAKRKSVLELTLCRSPPSAEEYSLIKQPTLLITGDKSPAHPVDKATETQKKIPGSHLFVLKGAPEMLMILPQYIGITHRVYLDFLNRQPPVSPFKPGKPNVIKMAREALELLAKLKGDPSIATRDPLNPLSFCMWSKEVAEAFQAQLDQFSIGLDKAFSPLRANGRPIRKFSNRHDHEWSSDHFAILRETIRNSLQGVRIDSETNHSS